MLQLEGCLGLGGRGQQPETFLSCPYKVMLEASLQWGSWCVRVGLHGTGTEWSSTASVPAGAGRDGAGGHLSISLHRGAPGFSAVIVLCFPTKPAVLKRSLLPV